MFAVAVKESIGIVLQTKDCGSILGTFSAFQMDCDEGSTAELCMISAGKKYEGSMRVTPNKIIKNGTILLHAIFGGVVVPFPLPDKDLCTGHNVTCPLKPDIDVVVSLALTVPPFAPKLNIVAKIEFKSSGEDLVCLEFQAKIH